MIEQPAGENDVVAKFVVDQAVDAVEAELALLSDSYRVRIREQASEVDSRLQPAGYRALLELVYRGPLTAGVLADRLGFDKSALSRQLNQLQDLELITRHPDPADRRSALIVASSRAITKVHDIRSAVADDFRRALSTWSAQDLRDLSRLLRQLGTTSADRR